MTHFLYINLAISDLLNCLLPSNATTIGLFNKRNVGFMNQPCLDTFGWLLSTLPIISLYIICFIYTARMWAIYRSLSYRAIFTCRRVAAAMIFFWIISGTYSAIPFMCSVHYSYIKEVSIITFSASRSYLDISKSQETLIMIVTVLIIDLPLLVVCFCSALSVWLLQRNTIFITSKPIKYYNNSIALYCDLCSGVQIPGGGCI